MRRHLIISISNLKNEVLLKHIKIEQARGACHQPPKYFDHKNKMEKQMEFELKKYSYDRRDPTTINQCINELVDGYADARVHMELGKNLFELIQDEWFHQFPLVRYKYASMLMHGYFCGPSEDDYIEGNKALGKELILPFAEAGLAVAQFDMGYGFHSCGSDKAYEENVKWMLKASRQDYYQAHNYLKFIYDKTKYWEFSIEIQMELLKELSRVFADTRIGSSAQNRIAEIIKEGGKY